MSKLFTISLFIEITIKLLAISVESRFRLLLITRFIQEKEILCSKLWIEGSVWPAMLEATLMIAILKKYF